MYYSKGKGKKEHVNAKIKILYYVWENIIIKLRIFMHLGDEKNLYRAAISSITCPKITNLYKNPQPNDHLKLAHINFRKESSCNKKKLK